MSAMPIIAASATRIHACGPVSLGTMTPVTS